MHDEKVNPIPLVSSHTTLSSLDTSIDKTESPSENESQGDLTEVSFEPNDPSNPVGFRFLPVHLHTYLPTMYQSVY